MNKEIITVGDRETMQRAAMLFKELPFHHLPVVDEHLQIVGMLSSTDLYLISYGFSLFKMTDRQDHNETLYQSVLVRDVMSKEVFSMDPTNTLRDAYDEFRRGRYRAIPIVSRDRVVGLVTPMDLVAALLDA